MSIRMAVSFLLLFLSLGASYASACEFGGETGLYRYLLCSDGLYDTRHKQFIVRFDGKQVSVDGSSVLALGYTNKVEKDGYRNVEATQYVSAWRNEAKQDVFLTAPFWDKSGYTSLHIIHKDVLDQNDMHIGLKPNANIKKRCRYGEGMLTCSISFIKTNIGGSYYSTDMSEKVDKWVVNYKFTAHSVGKEIVRRDLPLRSIGQCLDTTIAEISDRFGSALSAVAKPNSGTAVRYANGGFQVSYDYETSISRSKVSDKVRICLVEVPKDCPKGDTRGKVYRTTNLRTGEAWALPDSQHSCGGA